MSDVTMAERIARALLINRFPDCVDDAVWNDKWSLYLNLRGQSGPSVIRPQDDVGNTIRIFLEALREPTPSMLAYGRAAFHESRKKAPDGMPGPFLREAFTAMIDAALAELLRLPAYAPPSRSTP